MSAPCPVPTVTAGSATAPGSLWAFETTPMEGPSCDRADWVLKGTPGEHWNLNSRLLEGVG